jgi:hypothetical protein
MICGNITMPDLVSDKAFEITQSTPQASGATRIHFRYSGRVAPIQSGWFDVDLERRGLILGYEFEIKTKVAYEKSLGRLEYDTVHGQTVLKRYTMETPKWVSDRGSGSAREIAEYDINPDAETSDDEYYLSYYGIPEPAGVERPRRFPLWAAFALGAFVLGGIIIGWHIIKRRRASLV